MAVARPMPLPLELSDVCRPHGYVATYSARDYHSLAGLSQSWIGRVDGIVGAVVPSGGRRGKRRLHGGGGVLDWMV